jgi:hypothetical protein
MPRLDFSLNAKNLSVVKRAASVHDRSDCILG